MFAGFSHQLAQREPDVWAFLVRGELCSNQPAAMGRDPSSLDRGRPWPSARRFKQEKYDGVPMRARLVNPSLMAARLFVVQRMVTLPHSMAAISNFDRISCENCSLGEEKRIGRKATSVIFGHDKPRDVTATQYVTLPEAFVYLK